MQARKTRNDDADAALCELIDGYLAGKAEWKELAAKPAHEIDADRLAKVIAAMKDVLASIKQRLAHRPGRRFEHKGYRISLDSIGGIHFCRLAPHEIMRL